MLLTCRQSQAEGAFAVFVHRFACQTAGHLAEVFRGTGEEAKMWAAESGSDPEGLGLTADDVETEVAASGAPARRER